MSIHTYRARSDHDNKIRDAVALAAGPALLALVESGQRLNDPAGITRRDMNDREVYELVSILADYRRLTAEGSEERRRADAAMACGHGYTLMASCPGCDNDDPAYEGALPLITLHVNPTD